MTSSIDDLGRLADELASVLGADESARLDERAARLALDASEAAHVARAAEALEGALGFDAEEIAAVLDAGERDVAAIPPPDLPEDYEVLGEIGRGGMGVVYRAHQRSLDRTVAVKVLRPGDLLFGQAIRRFEREARALAKLRHRHIVSIHEVGEAEGQVWFSMDCIEGRSMGELVREGSMSSTRAVHLLKQVASAVAYVHAHGLVHRDLKPANILVDEHGDAVVTDFGLALEIGGDAGLTMTGQILGTPAYMSPEQARGDAGAIGEATDIYAMGTILYECLTGHRPFEDESPAMQVWSVLHRDPPAPRKRNRRVPEALETICMKAMRKRPDDRYLTARAFLEDLERFEEGRAIHAVAPTRAYRLGRFLRRHWVPVASAAGILVAAVLVFGLLIAPRLLRNPQPLLDAADEMMAQGDATAAASLYERAIRLSGGDPSPNVAARLTEARLAAAWEGWAEGRAPETLRKLHAAWNEAGRWGMASRSTDRNRLEWALATSYALTGRTEEAEEHFDHALRSWPEPGIRRSRGADAGAQAILATLVVPLSDRTDPRHEAAVVQLRAVARRVPHTSSVLLEALHVTEVEPYRMVVPLADAIALAEPSIIHPHERELRLAVRPLASRRLSDDLALAVAEPSRPVRSRLLLGTLLADLEDLPVRLAFGYTPEADVEIALTHLQSAWAAYRDLPRDEGLRRRIGRGLETAGAIEDEWRHATGVAQHGAALARTTVRNWIGQRAGLPAGTRPEQAATWYERHVGGAPATWLSRSLGFADVPTLEEAASLLETFREADLMKQAQTHFLLAQLAPKTVRVPVWGTRWWEGTAVLRGWRRLLGSGEDYVRLRLAWFVLGDDGWRMDLSTSRPVDFERPVKLHVEAPREPLPSTWFRVTLPGLPPLHRGDSEQSVALEAHLEHDVGEGGVELRLKQALRVSGSGRTLSTGQVSQVKARYAMSPDLNVGGWGDPDPFRFELSLVALETREASTADDTLAAWNERRRRDLEHMATEAENDEEAKDTWSRANRFLLDHQRTLSNVLGVATWLPLPEGIEELRRLDAELVKDGHLDEQPRLALLARLMAGDEAALDEAGFAERIARIRPQGYTDSTIGRDGEYWVRLLRLTSSERLRAFALGVLQRIELSDRAAGDLQAVMRRGAIELPATLVERIERGPTRDRSWWGLVKASWGLTALAALVLFLGLLATLLTLWPGLRRDRRLVPAAWLVVVGLVTACVTVSVGGIDLLPAVLGYAWVVLGCWILGHEAKDKARWIRLALFAAAALLSLKGLQTPLDRAEEIGVGCLTMFGFASLLPLTWVLRGDPVPHRWPWPFTLAYLLPLTVAYGFGVLGAFTQVEGSVTVSGLLAVVLLLALFVCVLWALVKLLGAARVRRAWLRTCRVAQSP